MSFAGLLDRSSVIQRRDVTTSFGSDTVSFTTVVANYQCRIYDITPVLTRRPGGEEVYITTRAAGFANVNIVAGSLLVEGSVTYEVLGVNPVHGTSDTHHIQMDLAVKSA